MLLQSMAEFLIASTCSVQKEKQNKRTKSYVFALSSNFQNLNYQHSLYQRKASASKTVKENY